MNIIQRVNLAIRVAFRGEKAVATMLPTWQDGKPEYSPTNFESLVKHGWRRNELIFACINKTANTAASVNLSIKGKRDNKELPDHKLARLLKRPNPMMSEFDFWASVIIYQKLAGRAVYEKERNRAGEVIALWPLRPDWLKPVKGTTTPIIGYIYTPPGFEDKPIPLELDDVLDFQLFDPLNRYHGWPPVAVAGRVGDVDNATTDYLKLFFEKGGTPPGLLKTVQKLNDVAVADIRRRWRERYGGAEHWLEPAVLDSDAEYQAIGSSFKDMGFGELDSRSESRICMVLDVPPILIGAKVGLDRATYSNYEQARQAWWEDSLLAQYRNMEDVIQNGLVPEFGDDIIAEWDFSKVAAFQEDINARWQRATAAWTANAITLNEFCLQAGLEDKQTAGDVYYFQMTGAGMNAQEAGDSAGKNTPTILGYHIEQGVVNRNEARQALGLEVEDETESRLLRDLTAKLAVAQMAINARIPPNQAFELVGLDVEIEEPEPAPQLVGDIDGETADETDEEPDTDEEGKYLLAVHSHKARKPPDDELRRRIEAKWGRVMATYFEGFNDRLETEVAGLHGVNGNGTR